MLRGFKTRLDLNNKQATVCAKNAGTARFAWNQTLAYIKDCEKRHEDVNKYGRNLRNWMVKNVKKNNKWMYEASKCSAANAVLNLGTAYNNYYSLQKKHNFKKGKYLKHKDGTYKLDKDGNKIWRQDGLPQFKKKGVNDSFTLDCENPLKIDGKFITLPKIGKVKCFEILPQVEVKSVTISKRADMWFISFHYEKNVQHTVKQQDTVGIDVGIKTLATLSDGKIFENKKPYQKAIKKIKHLQREVSRRFVQNAENQSNNYKKSKKRLARQHYRVSCVRSDTIHNITTYITRNYKAICIEDLNVRGMSKNHKLASAILDGGFFEFKRQILYKAEMYGCNVLVANTFYPSSKTCSECGSVKHNLKLSDRTYVCEECGCVIDRDVNASVNLKNLADRTAVAAFGEESQIGGKPPINVLCELGIKHQMYKFV